MRVELVVYNGVTFRRYPDAKKLAHRRYYQPGIADKKRGIDSLHREIWKAANGPIPPKHAIHHLDHDTSNNDLVNLACMSASEHMRHHARNSKWLRSPEMVAHMTAIRPLTVGWHRSDEGRAWHQHHAVAAYAKREPVPAICVQCGQSYPSISRRKDATYCSGKCASAGRRISGKDDEARVCVECGLLFRVNRHLPTQTCGRSCGMKRSHRLRRDTLPVTKPA